MPNRNYVKIGNILKRSACSNSNTTKYNSYHEAAIAQDNVIYDYDKLNNFLESELVKDKPKITNSIDQYTKIFKEDILSVSNASTYYTEALSLIERFNIINESFADKFASEFSSQIIPYMESDSLRNLNNNIERYDLLDNQKDIIKEAVMSNIAADRILGNDKRLSKRFNLENKVSKINDNNMESIVESCVDFIDTYKLPIYNKINTCIEEMVYLIDKNHIKCNKANLIKNITEGYLLRYIDLSDKDLQGIRKVLDENGSIADDEALLANDLFTNHNDDSINGLINQYLANSTKSAEDIKKLIDNLDNFRNTDIVNNIKDLIKLIWYTYKADTFSYNNDVYIDMIDYLMNKLKELAIENKISRNNIFSIINTLNGFTNTLTYSNASDQGIIDKVLSFKESISKGIKELNDFCAISYSDNNIQIIQQLNQESANIIPLNEFKIFKFHNLVNAAFHLDRFLANKIKGFHLKNMTKKKKFVKKARNILFGENTRLNYNNFDINNYITEDGKCDITVNQFYINEDNELEINNFLDEVCKEYNHLLASNNDFDTKAYYIINPGLAEIHVESSTGIQLTDEEKAETYKHLDPLFETYLNDVEDDYNLMENYYNPENRSLKETLTKCFEENDNLTVDHYKMIIECLQYLEVDNNLIESFTDNFKNYRYNYLIENKAITESFNVDYFSESSEIDLAENSFVKEENVPYEIQLEAYQILINVLEAGPIKKPNIKIPKIGKNKDNKLNNGDKPKKKFNGINLNDLRLSLEGLKSKFKDFNQKQKEASKQADFQSRQFAKALKNAFISDRREAIIKGSVIPSFSKLCRWGLVLTGLGLVTQNPIVPAIAAIGAFAVSKHLTKQERLLLLDEIETELEVVDKELANADSKNQIKKYRALLKYKKDLQRQYQRIKYNIRVGKDILPGSEVGVPHSND